MNPARPLSGTRLCALSDLTDPGAKGFSYRSGDALFMGFVVRVGDEAHGFIDRCPHNGFLLANLDGRYLTREGDLVVCSTHGALFRRGDGACIAGPCAGQRLTPWPVRVEDGTVLVA